MAGYSNVSGLTSEAYYHCFLNEHTSSILIGQYNVMGSVVAHLVLDVSITTLTLIESAIPEFAPFIEPFSIALTIVRTTLDDFYYDISYELSLGKGKSFGDKVVAFIRGFEEGIADIFTL